MTESQAWLQQSLSDNEAAERLLPAEPNGVWCHAVAKWQQAVEKAIKAIIASLIETRIIHDQIGFGHDVTRFVVLLSNLPRRQITRRLQSKLSALLNAPTRKAILGLSALAPHRPAQGSPLPKNTEYPFNNSTLNWTYPAATGVFSADECRRFRALAQRLVQGASRVVRTSQRKPRRR